MATATHPYASFLAGRDPVTVLGDTPARLTSLFERLGPAGLKESYAPGKWSSSAVICHLADCEFAFGYRWRQAVAQAHHVVEPFDQDSWAVGYGSLDGKAALDAFCAMRRWNLGWLKGLPPEAFAKPVTHPERGEETLKILLQVAAGHDLNHLGQLEQVAAKAGK